MEDRTNVSNQRGQGQGNKSGPGGNKPGQGGNTPGQGGGQQSGQKRGREGVPSEGNRTEGQHDRLGQGAPEFQGAYKGGRQETGGIPNPDDRDDDTSAGSFRGTANQESGVADSDDDDLDTGAKPGRNKGPNDRTRSSV